MKTLYLDLVSGISGDMFVGALLDLGVEVRDLERELGRLGVGGYHLHASKGRKRGITGTKFDVHFEDRDVGHGQGAHHHHHVAGGGHEPAHHHGHGGEEEQEQGQGHEHEGEPGHGHDGSRDFAAIRELIGASGLSPWVKEKATAVFRRIAEAEGKIHGHPPEQVHFHEVGAVDSIVDIVGACVGVERLGKPRVVASAVVEGTGWVTCAHGRFPVPTPATLEILAARAVAVSQCDEPHELVTPTGAALLAELVEEFGGLREFRLERVGYGLGTRENVTRPNVLRAVLGETAAALAAGAHDWESDTVAVLETNLDDVSPEILGQFAERVLRLGALDAFHAPIYMKKGRPGTLLTLLCGEADADRFSELMLTETSAFGVRRTTAERRKLRRGFREVATPFEEIRVKLGLLDGRVVQWAPEFESCRRAAESGHVPLKVVYEAAVRAMPVLEGEWSGGDPRDASR